MTPNESPVMAVGEALAVLDWSQGRADPVKLAAARATFAAMAAEVVALRESLEAALESCCTLTTSVAEADAKLAAAEARCERLEVAARALCGVLPGGQGLPYYAHKSELLALRALLAATRTTGG